LSGGGRRSTNGAFATLHSQKQAHHRLRGRENLQPGEPAARARYINKGQHIWCFKLTNRTAVDAAVGGNVARFINHSCHPNCYIDIKKGIIWIRAARNIRKGEELTYDYNTDGEGLIECRCRPDCQRLL
jgi:hypothetical protein